MLKEITVGTIFLSKSIENCLYLITKVSGETVYYCAIQNGIKSWTSAGNRETLFRGYERIC